MPVPDPDFCPLWTLCIWALSRKVLDSLPLCRGRMVPLWMLLLDSFLPAELLAAVPGFSGLILLFHTLFPAPGELE